MFSMSTVIQPGGAVYVTNASGGDLTTGKPAKIANRVGIVVKQDARSWESALINPETVPDGEGCLLITQGVVEVDDTAPAAALGDLLGITDANVLSKNVTSEEVQHISVDATGGTYTIAVAGGTVAAAAVVEATKGTGIADEVQTVTLTGATGGTFTLTWDDTGSNAQTTTPLAYNATGATVQTAMRALSNLADADVTVTGSAGGPYTVTFLTAFAKTDVRMIVANDALLTPKNVTAAIAYNASAATMQSALEATTYITPGDVVVTKPSAGEYTLTFGGALVDTNVAAVTTNVGSLTGGAGTATVTTEQAGAATITTLGRCVAAAGTRGLRSAQIRVDLSDKG